MPFTIGGDWIPEEVKPVKHKHPVKVIKEKKGNLVVTILLNLPLNAEALKKLCSQLKQRLACGGTVKDHRIELQGDHVETAKTILKQLKNSRFD